MLGQHLSGSRDLRHRVHIQRVPQYRLRLERPEPSKARRVIWRHQVEELAAIVKARGPALPMPSSLPLELPLTVQLLVGDPARPQCWQAVLETAIRNDESTVKAAQP